MSNRYFFEVNLVLSKNEEFFLEISSYFFSCFKCLRRMSYVNKTKKKLNNNLRTKKKLK